MSNIKITLKSGETKEFPKGTSYLDICNEFSAPADTVAGKINGEIISLCEKVYYDEVFEFVSMSSIEGRVLYKSGLKFIFLNAIKNLYKGSEIYFEHSVPIGIYASIDVDKVLTNIDISLIKEEMLKIVNSDSNFNKLTIRKKEALMLFNKNKEYEKANNVANIMDHSVSVFELNGYYNYFYSEMPYSTSCIKNFDIVYLGNNKIVLVLPNMNGEKISYVHNDKIINAFSTNRNWLVSQKTPYFENLNLLIGNGKIKKIMESNELLFNFEIERITKEIINRKDTKFVMIAGPSSSGKTTTTKRMASYLRAFGYDPILMSTDDYFLDRNQTPVNEKGDFDFERIDAIDLKLFNSDLNKLINGESICIPTYNFILGKKEAGEKKTTLKENSIVLIEGLHSLNDELTTDIDHSLKYKIYLSPFTSINVDRHNYVSTIDLRLIRRIIRDNRTRGYGVATTIHNWHVVRNGEEKYIFPYIQNADTILNTAMEFEVGVLKVFVEPLLLSVHVSSPYYAEARRLLCFLKQFFPIPGEYVNEDSILREFIGEKK
ncbi:MAG: hypothetical protein R3Y13_03350 [bacterium]